MRMSTTLAAIIFLGLLPGSLREASGKSDESGCATYGTAIEFVKSPSVAATRAKKEQKLVFVLHVSGNFEDPKFT